MTVEIGCVQDRDANRIGLKRGSRTRQRWECAEQSSPASELQEIPPRPDPIQMQHRVSFRTGSILPM